MLISLLVLILGFLISSWNKLSFCSNFIGLGFDQQAFLFWDWVRSLNLLPYKDFFYPYGLLLLLKGESVGWYLFSMLLLFVVIFFIFLLLKKILPNRTFSYSFFLAFCLYVGLFLDIDSFLRYSPLILFSLTLSYFASKNILFEKKSEIVVGLSVGLFFSFINDLFFYSALSYVIFSIIYLLINKSGKIDMKKLSSSIIYLSLGFLAGALPFLVFLFKTNSLGDFQFYYLSFKDMFVFAKIPFPPTLKYFENIFIITVVILAGFYILNNYQDKKRRNLTFYLIFSLFLMILFLEQKNIMRAIYPQISFIALILFFILLSEVRTKLTNLKIKDTKILIFFMNLIALIFLIITIERNYKFERIFRMSPFSISDCINSQLSAVPNSQFVEYKNVRGYIMSVDQKAKIFSFPADPIFYVLFNQIPPFYPSIYEATPQYAQKKMISYIEENKINYVIYNRKSDSIQDDVPDKIRAKLLFDYITDNFIVQKRIKNFLILRKISSKR